MPGTYSKRDLESMCHFEVPQHEAAARRRHGTSSSTKFLYPALVSPFPPHPPSTPSTMLRLRLPWACCRRRHTDSRRSRLAALQPLCSSPLWPPGGAAKESLWGLAAKCFEADDFGIKPFNPQSGEVYQTQ